MILTFHKPETTVRSGSVKYFLRKALLLAILLSVSACSPPNDQSEARRQLIQNGFVRTWRDPPATPEQAAQNSRQLASNMASSVSISSRSISFSPQTLINAYKTAPGPKNYILFSPAFLSSSINVKGKEGCVGDSGSLLPPLSLSTCTTAALNLPITMLYDLQSSLTGHSNRLQVRLNGIDRFFVPQDKDNYCWAASFETARNFLHLPAIPQENLVGFANSVCKVSYNEMPSMYQIAYVIEYVKIHYDKAQPEPKFCTDTECIITSVYNQQPVMMLMPGEDGKGHVVLVVGVDYDTGMAQGKRVYIPRSFSILDPADNPRSKTATLWEACHADAFIVY